MRITERDLTDAEIKKAFYEILEIATGPSEPDAAKKYKSRAEEEGYKLNRFLFDAGIIEPGQYDPQRRMRT